MNLNLFRAQGCLCRFGIRNLRISFKKFDRKDEIIKIKNDSVQFKTKIARDETASEQPPLDLSKILFGLTVWAAFLKIISKFLDLEESRPFIQSIFGMTIGYESLVSNYFNVKNFSVKFQ